jgi:hypothetical protein
MTYPTSNLDYGSGVAAATLSTYTQTFSTANRTVALPTQETLTDSTTGTASNTLAAGVGIETLCFQFDLADIADGELVTDYTIGYKFKILSAAFAVTEAVTTGSKATQFMFDIGTTAVTSMLLNVTSATATPVGVVIAGVAPTGANTGSASAVISVRATSTTAFAEGKGTLLIRVQNMDTADAFASLVDEHAKGAADDLDNRQALTAIIDDLQAISQ